MLARVVLVGVSVACAALAVVVYHRAPDRVWNRIFAVHAGAVSAWVFLNYLIQQAVQGPPVQAMQGMFLLYAAIGLASALIYRRIQDPPRSADMMD